MLIDPYHLSNNWKRLEEIEKASLRFVVQAIYNYREMAQEIFQQERDLVADIGEDITREALDRLGMAKIDQRLFGKIDYKQARYIFHPEYAIKQALFVDSKAEHFSGKGTATLQTSQFSLTVHQIRGGEKVEVRGKLPTVLEIQGEHYITTTIFVKYNYTEEVDNYSLKTITVAALPNGFLQEKYNPKFASGSDNIWRAGRNAPSRGEAFRVRLSFSALKTKEHWRVQEIPIFSGSFVWED
ncbi:MAG: BglI family type II restriction endonuclease [Anaerolineae bacterium]|nr:BglI family type II restriction endonuclease [Anaerolineae bacterium]